eukprot:2808501-Pleurochrysis_carterae.AAC.1
MGGTGTQESSVRRLRGAPASVVDRQRPDSNLRGVAPWQIMRVRSYGSEVKPFGKEMRWGKITIWSGRSTSKRTPYTR